MSKRPPDHDFLWQLIDPPLWPVLHDGVLWRLPANDNDPATGSGGRSASDLDTVDGD